MLLMIESEVRGGMCQSVYRHAKANNKYMKNYNKSIESSYLMYLDANNLYGWAVSKKLPINGFKWENDLSRFNEKFIKNYNENSDVGYFLEVDIEDKEKYVIHIIALKQALNHGLVLKYVHRVIKFNQEAWLKLYINMITKLRTESKNEFEKDFSS